MSDTLWLDHAVNATERADGTIVLTSGLKLGHVAKNTGEWLHKWAVETPDRVFIAERSGEGWREVTYAQTLEMVRNPDILAEVAQQKSAGHGPRITVGFAAETENLLANAKSKLERKKLDLIVANDVTASDAGFAVDTNRVTLLARDGSVQELPLLSKSEVAVAIFEKIRR